MTYAQILAGAVSFQLYNKSTNAVVPTSVSDGGGYIEITEDATSDHNTVYKIDQFNGAVSEITLYTEGDSAKTYALLGASYNEGVHSIRGFRCSLETDYSYVVLEIDGRIYLPYSTSDQYEKLINWNNTLFESNGEIEMAGFIPMIPKVAVEINADFDELTIPSFDNLTIGSDELTEITNAQGIINNKIDGVIFTPDGIVICVNGVYKLLSTNGANVAVSVTPSRAGWQAVDRSHNVTTIYDSSLSGIEYEGDVVTDGGTLELAKQDIEDEYGITIADGYFTCNEAGADGMPAIWQLHP